MFLCAIIDVVRGLVVSVIDLYPLEKTEKWDWEFIRLSIRVKQPEIRGYTFTRAVDYEGPTEFVVLECYLDSAVPTQHAVTVWGARLH